MDLSGTEEWVLMVVVALRDQAYGVSIHDQLREAGAQTSLGAIYTGLERLERRGFVTSVLGEASPSRGGRRKRVFRATPRGRQVLREIQAMRERLRALQTRTI
jgi:DNA-binding PadR family transcriptional regulator